MKIRCEECSYTFEVDPIKYLQNRYREGRCRNPEKECEGSAFPSQIDLPSLYGRDIKPPFSSDLDQILEEDD